MSKKAPVRDRVRKKRQTPRAPRQARPPQTQHPVAISAVSQVDAFQVPRGIASVLTDARPSQKFTARAVGTITIPANDRMYMNVSPCIISDGASAVALVGTSAELDLATSTFESTTVGSGWTSLDHARFTSNTPYDAASVGDADYHWRLVSSGVRIRNVTAPLYRSGVLRYNVDLNQSIKPIDNTTVTFSDLIDTVNASHRTVRKSFVTDDTVEITVPNQNAGWSSAATGAREASNWSEGYSDLDFGRSGGTTSGAYFRPGILHLSLENGSAGSQVLDVEIIEHWEISGSQIETLLTPSAVHEVAHQAIKSVLGHAHHQHSLTPHVSFKSIVKGAMKLEHNKTAMEGAELAGTALLAL